MAQVIRRIRDGGYFCVVVKRFGFGWLLMGVFLSLALHTGFILWWFAATQLHPRQASVQTVTVDLIAPPAPAPEPASSAARQPVTAESERLDRADMAEQIKITRKPLTEKRQMVRKTVVQPSPPPVPAAGQSVPVTPAATPAAAATAAPAAVSAQISAARYDADYLNNPPPTYPPLSRRLGEEGRVVLRVQVSADGKPLRVELKSTSGFERLDNAARKAAEGWRFVPARQAGVPVLSWVEVPLQFSLKK